MYKFGGCKVHNRNHLASLLKTFTSCHIIINDIQNLVYDKWYFRNTFELDSNSMGGLFSR